MYNNILFYLLSCFVLSFVIIRNLIKENDFYGHKVYEYFILFLMLFGWPITVIFSISYFIYEDFIEDIINNIKVKIQYRIKDYKIKRIIKLRKKYVRQLNWN